MSQQETVAEDLTPDFHYSRAYFEKRKPPQPNQEPDHLLTVAQNLSPDAYLEVIVNEADVLVGSIPDSAKERGNTPEMETEARTRLLINFLSSSEQSDRRRVIIQLNWRKEDEIEKDEAQRQLEQRLPAELLEAGATVEIVEQWEPPAEWFTDSNKK